MKMESTQLEYRLPGGQSVHREETWEWVRPLFCWLLFFAVTMGPILYNDPSGDVEPWRMVLLAVLLSVGAAALPMVFPRKVCLTLAGHELIIESWAPLPGVATQSHRWLRPFEASPERHDLRGCRGVLLERDRVGPYLRLVYNDGNEFLRVVEPGEAIAAWVRTGVERVNRS